MLYTEWECKTGLMLLPPSPLPSPFLSSTSHLFFGEKEEALSCTYCQSSTRQNLKHTDILLFVRNSVNCWAHRVFFSLIFIGVELLYNAVSVFAVQQSESAMCIHIYPFPTLHLTYLGHHRAQIDSISYSLLVCSDFLFLHNSDLVVVQFVGI